MKIADIVTQLATVLPLLSTRYTSFVDVSTVSGDGSVATVVTASANGLSVGSPVFITNVAVDTAITTVTVTGSTAVVETATDHDLTLGWPPHATVPLSGFTDGAWNSSFALLSVPNRRKFSIDVGALTVPTLNGNEILEELVTGGFNGPHSVASIIDPTTFTFASTFSTSAGGGQVVTQIRLAGAESGARAEAEYTKQQTDDDLWLFVTQPDTVSVSKDRRALGDAVSEQSANTSYELDLLDGFTVWCFVPATNSKAGLGPSDTARDLVLRDLLLAIQRYKPASGLANDTPSRVVLRSHGPAAYTGAYYVHQFVFEVPLRMTTDDTLTLTSTVAFRDVGLTINNPESDAVLTALVNLDEVPIP